MGVSAVAVNHVSNALGTINPVKEMIVAAHEVGAVVSLRAQGFRTSGLMFKTLIVLMLSPPISSMGLLAWCTLG